MQHLYISLCALFLPSTIYVLLLIFPGPSIFSRIFSNVENILTTRWSTEAKNRSKVPKVAPKPAQNLHNL